MQILLGYSKWENFIKVIDKAKEACEHASEHVLDHFPDVRKTIAMPKGAEKAIDDMMLTRYACYLIAQNGDSRKEQISFAQNYFAVQTRKAELIEQRLLEYERVKAREKLGQTEKQLSGVQITIVTWAPDSYGFGDAAYWMQLHEEMRKAGFYIKTVEESCERFAVIDQEVVWYGNINLLAKDKVDDSIMRVLSKEIASELMEITFGDNG